VKGVSYALCLLVALAIAIGGCGDDGDTSASPETSATTPAPTAETEDTAVDRPKKGAWGVAFGAEGDELGIIIYDLAGHTLYTFSKDKGETSSCYGACAKTWPPALTEGKPKAGGEALPGKVGSAKRKDGTVQLTYAGHPLYRYLPDRSPETNGHGRESFGGRWFAIRPNGERP
jgi:predicted lipoprotein with Yx(FWY)xxD motif